MNDTPRSCIRRRSAVAGWIGGLLLLGWIGIAAHGWRARDAAEARRAESAVLVDALGVTDLALFNEARYTRHPGLADLHSAFQDAPGGPEHFPTGALVPPPPHLSAGALSITRPR